jgi:hypothetical protein
MVVVQNVTTSSINMPGLNAQSGRSLNNGQGINVPLVFHPDGTFEGFGSGADSGNAAGAIPGETVRSQFGHTQAVQASGFVRPGDCTSKPCQPDVMHLVLVGGPSQQMMQAQARGQFNRDMQQTTTTNSANLEFDLPAYIGGSAQKTFLSTPILNSYMTVNVVQANNNTPALPVGSSLLYSLQQCKLGARAPAVGGGAVAGVVIPGLEGVSATPSNKPVSGLANKNDIGVIIPGLEGNLPPNGKLNTAVNTPIVIRVDEKINAVDSTDRTNSTVIAVNETIHVGDAPTPLPAAQVSVSEAVQVKDDVAKTQSTVINVGEHIKVGDAPLAPSTATLPKIPSTGKTLPK